MVSQKVSVTLRGKEYVISTHEPSELVERASELLDGAMRQLSEHQVVHREDQLALFGALQAMVALLKEHEEANKDTETQVSRLEALLQENA